MMSLFVMMMMLMMMMMMAMVLVAVVQGNLIWSCGLPKTKAQQQTKRRIDKFLGLEDLIRKFHADHEFVRGSDEPCSFAALEATFVHMVKERRSEQIRGNIDPDVPPFISRGWFSQMKTGIGILKSAVASNEVRRLTVEDSRAFWTEYKGKAEKIGIKIMNVVSFDEYNDFLSRLSKYVQSREKGRKKTVGRQTKRTGNARITVTGGVLFSPLRKGKMIIFMDRCPKKVKEQIERDFGDMLIIITNQGCIAN